MSDLLHDVQGTAEKAVEAYQDRAGGALDFSEQSLSMVEEMAAEAAQWAHEMTSDQLEQLAREFGCYILEVARREFGGKYHWYTARDQPVLVVGEPNYRVSIIAWDKVLGRLRGDEADNIPFFYSGFAEAARSAKPGTEVLYV